MSNKVLILVDLCIGFGKIIHFLLIQKKRKTDIKYPIFQYNNQWTFCPFLNEKRVKALDINKNYQSNGHKMH